MNETIDTMRERIARELGDIDRRHERIGEEIETLEQMERQRVIDDVRRRSARNWRAIEHGWQIHADYHENLRSACNEAITLWPHKMPVIFSFWVAKRFRYLWARLCIHRLTLRQLYWDWYNERVFRRWQRNG